MTLRAKVLSGFFGMLVLTSIVGYIGMHSTSIMERQSNQSDFINASLAAMLRAQGEQLRYALYTEDRFVKLFGERLNASLETGRKSQIYMEDPERIRESERYIGDLESYGADFNQLVDLTQKGKNSREQLFRDLDEIGKNLQDVSRIIRQVADASLDRRIFEVQSRILTILNEFSALRLSVIMFEVAPDAQQTEQIRKSFKTLHAHLEMLWATLTREDSQNLCLRASEGFLAAEKPLENFLASALDRLALREDVRKDIEKTTTLATELAAGATAGVQKASADADILIMIVMALALLAGLVMAWLIARNVQNLLGKDPAVLQQLARRVTNGDYDIDDGSPQKGVYGYLAAMVAALKENIEAARAESERAARESARTREAMQNAETAGAEARAKTQAMLAAADKLEEVAAIVSSASGELSTQIAQSERGASEQAVRVTETATAMEEMNSTVMEVARNAGQASDVSAQTREKADSGASVVQQAVESIGQVQQESLALKNDMVELAEQAQAISRIMGVISDIADQTNLLALNAAIEAARAGEAGRGFAVVADEVRKLAEKTMASTTDVGDAIKAIQDSASRSMAQVDRAVRVIGEATDYATRSGYALKEIVDMADSTADQVRAIAAASEQQSASSEEISKSITQVNTIAGETARSMKEAARSVADLSQQALVLTRLIEDMKRG